MKSYVLATQQEWGMKAFEILKSRGGEWWLTRTVAGMRESIMPAVRYVFCVNFSNYVPPDVLAMAEFVNFHACGSAGGTFHRGGGPLENLILRGYTETMIAAHRMSSEIDAGDVYAAVGPISLAGTKAQILERFIDPVVALIREIVETEPEPYPQVGEIVTFKRLPKSEMEALWSARP